MVMDTSFLNRDMFSGDTVPGMYDVYTVYIRIPVIDTLRDMVYMIHIHTASCGTYMGDYNLIQRTVYASDGIPFGN